mgnify:CR=1 FL=1
MNIQWYPGHMKKAWDMVQSHLKLVDVALELRDARAPLASENPMFAQLLQGKKRLLLLNKADLADPVINREWTEYFASTGLEALTFNAKSDDTSVLISRILKEGAFVHEKNRRQGRKPRPIRLMVIGVPNVGKSSLINRLVGRTTSKIEDRPGVTRGKQWVRLRKDLELFDTPGILWPKFVDQQKATHLAFLGSINDLILDMTLLAVELIETIIQLYPGALSERYGIEESGHPQEIFETIGRQRGAILSGDRVDHERTAVMLLDEFRAAKIGRISLERPKS